MPIYEYQCVDCERAFEAFVRSGRDDAECPHCGGSHLTRQMSTFASHASNGDVAGAARSAIGSNGAPAFRSGGGCCGGGCGCH